MSVITRVSFVNAAMTDVVLCNVGVHHVSSCWSSAARLINHCGCYVCSVVT